MQILRTSEDRFDGLLDYPFAPHYADVVATEGSGQLLRAHYLDETSADAGSGEVVVLLHGEPSWSYLYRHMIPPLVAAGHRCIAPDLIGFGRSDKPTERSDYTYQRHVEWLRELLFDRLDLTGVTLVGQDWGGLLGLRLVGEHPERFARVVAANTFLPTGDHHPGEAFLAWQHYSQQTPNFRAGKIVAGGCTSEPAPAVVAAYDAPFPDETYLAGARQFPMLVPTSPDDPAAPANRRAWESLARFDRPFLCAFSDGDPITGAGEPVLRARIPGCAKVEHVTITGGGHFLQEDRGPELAAAIIDFIAAT